MNASEDIYTEKKDLRKSRKIETIKTGREMFGNTNHFFIGRFKLTYGNEKAQKYLNTEKGWSLH